MESSFFAVLQFIFGALFFITLAVGGYLLKNHKKIFGVDAQMPSENGSARALGSVQIWSIWAHVLIASAAFALLLH